jgi:uncharacterized RmlC-like cupin family protein
VIPSAGRDGAPESARLVSADEAFLGSEEGIEFWRGVDSEAQGTQAFLARARCAPGTRIPPHWHSEDTIAYLAEGKAVFRSGDDLADVHEMGAGDWLFVPAGMVHVEETPADSSGDFLYARAGAGGETTYLEEDPSSSPG